MSMCIVTQIADTCVKEVGLRMCGHSYIPPSERVTQFRLSAECHHTGVPQRSVSFPQPIRGWWVWTSLAKKQRNLLFRSDYDEAKISDLVFQTTKLLREKKEYAQWRELIYNSNVYSLLLPFSSLHLLVGLGACASA